MKHYSIEKWADYMRGLVDGGERAEMQRHLDGACAQCNRMLERMRAVQSALLEEVEVPEAFLEGARGIFRRNVAVAPVRRLIAILSFDTFAEPVPVGVRGGTQQTRRLAYAVEDFKIELLVMTGAVKGRAGLTGQVTTSGAGLIGPVRLISKNRVVSSVPASEFGEFQMEFEVRSGLRLVIPCAGRRAEIEVPLDVLFQRKNGSAKPDSK